MLKCLCLGVAASLSSVVFGDDHSTAPFFSVSLDVTLESVEYDSTNSLLYYQDFFGGLIYYVNYDSDAISDGTFTVDDAAAFDNGNMSLVYPTGMYSDGTNLYVCSAALSYITVYDIDSKSLSGYIPITYNGESTILNGICNDPTSDDIIYVTAPGVDFFGGAYTNDSALYRVNTTSGDYTIAANFGNDEHPNGCTVSSDGSHVYMVSIWLDGVSGNFIRYKTSDETYSVLSGMESAPGDGIIFDNDGNLYFTMWGTNSTNGKLYQFEDGFETGSSVSFELFATQLNNPADMCYDAGNNWAIIPNFDLTSNAYAGSISWIDLSEDDDDSSVNIKRVTFAYGFAAIIVAILTFM